MKTLVSSLICVIWTMALAAAQSPSPATGNFRIAGVVVHSLTGQPLPGIQMSILRAQTPDVLQAVVAADSGRFTFQVSDPGKYVLVAQGRGFPRQAWDEHNGFSTAVVVGPGKDSENIVFRARPEASVSGTVTDEANEPVREAQVMLFHRGVEEGNDAIHLRTQTSTDDQGHYHFAHLFSGTFFIVVSAQPWYAHTSPTGPETDPLNVTYPLTYFSGSTEAGGAAPITVRPGDKITADLSLTAVQAIRLEVTRLMRPNSGSAPNATRKVFGSYSVSAANQYESGADGRMFMTGLAPGEVEISVTDSKNPRNGWRETLNVAAGVRLKAPSDHSAIAVGGKLIFNQPKAGSAVIILSGRSSHERFQALVNPDGSFQFSGPYMPPDTYQVAIFYRPGSVLASIAAIGAKVDGRTIEVAPGADVQLTVVMSRGASRIDGTVLREGKPVAGAMIVLLPHDWLNNQSLIRRDQSDSDGTFTLPQIPPGRYTALALQNGWEMDWQNAAVLKPYLPHAQIVLVSPDQRYEMKITAQ